MKTFDIILGILLAITLSWCVLIISIKLQVNKNDQLFTPITPRGESFAPWTPEPSTGTSTLPAPTNLVPEKYQAKQCYYLSTNLVCQ